MLTSPLPQGTFDFSIATAFNVFTVTGNTIDTSGTVSTALVIAADSNNVQVTGNTFKGDQTVGPENWFSQAIRISDYGSFAGSSSLGTYNSGYSISIVDMFGIVITGNTIDGPIGGIHIFEGTGATVPTTYGRTYTFVSMTNNTFVYSYQNAGVIHTGDGFLTGPPNAYSELVAGTNTVEYDSHATDFVDPRQMSVTASGSTVEWVGVSPPATDVQIDATEVNGFLYDGESYTTSTSPPLLTNASVLVDRSSGAGGTVTARGQTLPNQGAANAFDNSVTDKWLDNSSTSWIEYQFPNNHAYVITQYIITSGSDTATYPGRAPKSWVLEGSNNGTSWTTVDTETNQADTVSDDTRTYSFTNSTAYSYYQFASIVSNGDSIIQIAEIRLFGPDPTLVDWTRTGGTVTARGDNPPNEIAKYAFDGSNTTKWLDFASPSWIEYQFPNNQAYVVTQYTITSASDTATYPSRAPDTWTLQGSDDGLSWTTLDSRTGQSDVANLDTMTFKINNSTAYEYYRFDPIYLISGATMQLAEIHLYGPTQTGQLFGPSMATIGSKTTLPIAGDAPVENLRPLPVVAVPVLRTAPSGKSPVRSPQMAGTSLSGPVYYSVTCLNSFERKRL